MRVEDLYALPPSEFTRSRDALAKELQAAGEEARASEVKALRKPSKAAWAVNQLARWRRDDVDELIEAADRLTRAHRALMAGDGDANAVRDADRAERAIVARLVSAAAGFLEEAGLGATAATLRSVETTLHASAIGSDEQRDALASGTITDELDPIAGFGPTDVAIAANKRRAKGAKSRSAKGAESRSLKPAKGAESRSAKAAESRSAKGAESRSLKPAKGAKSRSPKPAKPQVDRAARARQERLRRRLDRLRAAADRAEAAAERAREKVAEAERELRDA